MPRFNFYQIENDGRTYLSDVFLENQTCNLNLKYIITIKSCIYMHSVKTEFSY